MIGLLLVVLWVVEAAAWVVAFLAAARLLWLLTAPTERNRP